jgi:hypothetical protein
VIQPDLASADLWIEAAPDFHALRGRVMGRGHPNLAIVTRTEVWLSAIPTGTEGGEVAYTRKGNYPVQIDPIALKRIEVGVNRMRAGHPHPLSGSVIRVLN